MGLDIDAYSRATYLETLDNDAYDEKYGDDRNVIYIYDRTAGVHASRTEGVIIGGAYRKDGEHHAFRAGSYSGYNEWRNDLSRLMLGVPANVVWGGGAYAGKPFYELIDFSDCEGIIGPVVAAKLARDFAEHQGKADAYQDQEGGETYSDYWREKYADWRKAFELAADGGFVYFG